MPALGPGVSFDALQFISRLHLNYFSADPHRLSLSLHIPCTHIQQYTHTGTWSDLFSRPWVGIHCLTDVKRVELIKPLLLLSVHVQRVGLFFPQDILTCHINKGTGLCQLNVTIMVYWAT